VESAVFIVEQHSVDLGKKRIKQQGSKILKPGCDHCLVAHLI